MHVCFNCSVIEHWTAHNLPLSFCSSATASPCVFPKDTEFVICRESIHMFSPHVLWWMDNDCYRKKATSIKGFLLQASGDQSPEVAGHCGFHSLPWAASAQDRGMWELEVGHPLCWDQSLSMGGGGGEHFCAEPSSCTRPVWAADQSRSSLWVLGFSFKGGGENFRLRVGKQLCKEQPQMKSRGRISTFVLLVQNPGLSPLTRLL